MADQKTRNDHAKKADQVNESKGCITLVSSPLILFTKIFLNNDTKRNKQVNTWYGKDTQTINFVADKKKCIKQMFQEEFKQFSFSPSMFDSKQTFLYTLFLRTVSDPDIQHLGTKEFKRVAWQKWADKLKLIGQDHEDEHEREQKNEEIQ